MNRTHSNTVTPSAQYQDLVKRTAFHEAGHATSIYLYNKNNSLPPVFFQITTKELCCHKFFAEPSDNLNNKHFVAHIEGGRLIQNPSIPLVESKNKLNKTEQLNYQAAYEADIINLLVGPLSEAKHVALRDDEPFNSLLINPDALKFYGGESDLKSIQNYLNHFIDNELDRKLKLKELFSRAFHFIDNKTHWKAIASLAEFIENNKNKTISCEQAFQVLDKSIALLSAMRN